MTEPFRLVGAREAWARLHPETVNFAAARLSGHAMATAKVMKNQRFRDPASFPDPIPLNGRYHNSRASIYSAPLMDLWVAADRDIRNADPAKVKVLTDRVAKAVETVQPAQLSHAALVMLPDVHPDIAVRRIRGWKDNRHVNGFPEPLEVDADYVVAAMVFSLRELVGWRKWYDRWKASPEGIAASMENYRNRAARGAATKAAAARA